MGIEQFYQYINELEYAKAYIVAKRILEIYAQQLTSDEKELLQSYVNLSFSNIDLSEEEKEEAKRQIDILLRVYDNPNNIFIFHHNDIYTLTPSEKFRRTKGNLLKFVENPNNAIIGGTSYTFTASGNLSNSEYLKDVFNRKKNLMQYKSLLTLSSLITPTLYIEMSKNKLGFLTDMDGTYISQSHEIISSNADIETDPEIIQIGVKADLVSDNSISLSSIKIFSENSQIVIPMHPSEPIPIENADEIIDEVKTRADIGKRIYLNGDIDISLINNLKEYIDMQLAEIELKEPPVQVTQLFSLYTIARTEEDKKKILALLVPLYTKLIAEYDIGYFSLISNQLSNILNDKIDIHQIASAIYMRIMSSWNPFKSIEEIEQTIKLIRVLSDLATSENILEILSKSLSKSIAFLIWNKNIEEIIDYLSKELNFEELPDGWTAKKVDALSVPSQIIQIMEIALSDIMANQQIRSSVDKIIKLIKFTVDIDLSFSDTEYISALNIILKLSLNQTFINEIRMDIPFFVDIVGKFLSDNPIRRYKFERNIVNTAVDMLGKRNAPSIVLSLFASPIFQEFKIRLVAETIGKITNNVNLVTENPTILNAVTELFKEFIRLVEKNNEDKMLLLIEHVKFKCKDLIYRWYQTKGSPMASFEEQERLVNLIYRFIEIDVRQNDIIADIVMNEMKKAYMDNDQTTVLMNYEKVKRINPIKISKIKQFIINQMKNYGSIEKFKITSNLFSYLIKDLSPTETSDLIYYTKKYIINTMRAISSGENPLDISQIIELIKPFIVYFDNETFNYIISTIIDMLKTTAPVVVDIDALKYIVNFILDIEFIILENTENNEIYYALKEEGISVLSPDDMEIKTFFREKEIITIMALLQFISSNIYQIIYDDDVYLEEEIVAIVKRIIEKSDKKERIYNEIDAFIDTIMNSDLGIGKTSIISMFGNVIKKEDAPLLYEKISENHEVMYKYNVLIQKYANIMNRLNSLYDEESRKQLIDFKVKLDETEKYFGEDPQFVMWRTVTHAILGDIDKAIEYAETIVKKIDVTKINFDANKTYEKIYFNYISLLYTKNAITKKEVAELANRLNGENIKRFLTSLIS